MDETQPLLQHPNDDSPPCSADENIVDFDPDGDPENPMDWPKAYKSIIVALLAMLSFTTTFTCISVVPVANRIVKDLDGGSSNKSASVLLVTIWEIGEAAGPLLIAPLSELSGRYPVIIGANSLFILATIVAALSPNVGLLIAARFLTGLAVASNVLNPAIIGDIFVSEHRGAAMGLMFLAPLVGGAVGPAMSGAIAEGLGWRSVIWLSAILAGVCQAVFILCFRETFKITLLARKAARLRRETGNQLLRTPYEVSSSEKKAKVLESILRPAIVLCSSGVLQVMSVFGSVAFTYFYIMSTTLPDILEGIYALSPAMTGFCFIAFSAGSALATLTCNLFLDRIYLRLRDADTGDGKGRGKPEYRLPLLILGALVAPLIVALYGWVPQARLPLPLMLGAVMLLGACLTLTFLPLISYVVDAFGLYSASAMTAVIVIRCLMGTFLPLTTTPLVEIAGWGWAFTILAGFSLGLAPIPILVLRYGAQWRQRSPYSKDE